MKKMISVMMATVMLLTMICSFAVSPVSAKRYWNEDIKRVINLIDSPREATKEDCRLFERDGVIEMDAATEDTSEDFPMGMVIMPMLENVNLTDMYLHIGILSNTPFRIVTMDIPNNDPEKALGFELVSEFEIAPVGKPPINVNSKGELVYPKNGFIPGGEYEICVPYGEMYQWYEDNGVPNVDTDKANMSAIYIDVGSYGKVFVSTLKLSTESTFSTYTNKYPYLDVRKGEWYYNAMEYVTEKEFMTGYKNGNFGPGDMLQRQDFVLTLARVADVNLNWYFRTELFFEDTQMYKYYSPAVAWAVDNGIITGYNEHKFGVGDTVTREQVATILYRFCGSPVVENVDETLKAFPDASRISGYAKEAMAWAVQNGVISGLKSGKIAPGSGASRAQIATIIMRMDQSGLL